MEDNNPNIPPMQTPPTMPPMPPKKPTDAMGIVSMIIAIVSILSCCCAGLGIIPAIVALILAIVAKKDPMTGKKSGFAKAGLIISIISIVFNAVIIIWAIFVATRLSVDLSHADIEEIKQALEKYLNEYGYSAHF